MSGLPHSKIVGVTVDYTAEEFAVIGNALNRYLTFLQELSYDDPPLDVATAIKEETIAVEALLAKEVITARKVN